MAGTGRQSNGWRPVDMSRHAIDRRLRILGELYRLALALREAKRIGKPKDILKR